MAVIQKIREKYAKLAGFVIALALVGFLLMDAGDNLKSFFSGGDYIAKVEGDKIEPKEYAERINEYESLYELMGNKVDDNMRAQIHEQVLRELIFEQLTEDQLEDLGITVTKEEEKEMITGANPDPMVMQFPHFRNPETGQFDAQYLMAFEKNQLPASADADKAMQQWKQFKSYMKRQRLMQKYTSLFTGAVHTPKFLIDRQAKDQNMIASIRFVKVPFASINDAEVKVTDADLKQYIEQHPAQYRLDDPTRSIEYVSFDVQPSHDDTARSYETLVKLKSEFAGNNDPESFVNRNSDEPYSAAFVNRKTFMNPYADSIFSLSPGSVYGPYFDNGSYKLTKVVERATLPDSTKVRHILVKFSDRNTPILADSLAKKKIDSVEAGIKSGVDFNTLVNKYSDDPGSKSTGGEYTFTLQQRPQLSKEFADFAFEGKPGEKKVVKVENDAYGGYHYIEIISQQGFQPSAKLATVSKSLFAGEETENAAYAKANEFAGRNTNAKSFDETVKAQNLNKLQAQNIKVNDFVIAGLGSSRDIIRWMYNADVGDVSPVFNLDGRYVIAKLSNVQEKGLVGVDETNRPALEALVRAEKKAKLITEKYKNMSTLDAIAQAAAQPVQAADSFNATSNYLANLGFEPKVVGYTFFEGFKPNTKSPAIKGSDGVFFVSLVQRKQMAVNADPMQQQQQMMMQQMQMKNSMSSMIQESVRRGADIKYSADNLY
jgi:peptidyl-prolyl cis-trans isomerase D